MSVGTNPCLNIAIDRLKAAGNKNFAIWVTHSPFPGGYVHSDSNWSDTLTRKWVAWQEMFSLQSEIYLPVSLPAIDPALTSVDLTLSNPNENYSGRLMQELGISLWQWVFEGTIRQTFAQSQGLAAGKNKPLRLRLEIHDPHLIALPWEIMQPAVGKQAISLDPQILFSRTTSNVASLAPHHSRESIDILLVLGECEPTAGDAGPTTLPLSSGLTLGQLPLDLDLEAAMLAKLIEQSGGTAASNSSFLGQARTRVTTLVQPTPAELIEALDSRIYNVFFYAGHGIPDANGGLLFLHGEDGAINGTELAQVLVRNQIILGVFNACWGAQPQQNQGQTLERSSLAEVLIHHGVPAVLAMRDAIADEEALCFIRAFTKALTQRLPIDQAMRVARQQLVTLYRFNQPVWTLPILYMHPEFDGELVVPITEEITVLPHFAQREDDNLYPTAYLQTLEDPVTQWKIYGGMMRVGRRQENDLVIPEKWVSQRHAEIICREQPDSSPSHPDYRYFLRDFSRFGTSLLTADGWQKVHHEEVPLPSGTQLKFGSPYGQPYEFVIGDLTPSAP